MMVCRGVSIHAVLGKQAEILDGLKNLFMDDEFRKAIDAQTNTPVYFRTRVIKMKNMLHQALEK